MADNETREMRKVLLGSAVDQFLDHLEDELDGEGELGAIVIAVELHSEDDEGCETAFPTYWCSNESAIWQRGFFECLADYGRLMPKRADPDS